MDTSTMVTETIFAYRFSGRDGWEVRGWECTKEELLEEIKMTGWDLDDLQVLREHQISKGLNEYFVLDVALSQHWLRDHYEKHWVPMKEPLTNPGQETSSGEVVLSLLSIENGSALISAAGPGTTISIQLTSSQDDLVDLVRFSALLKNGAYPHLVFAGHDVNIFAVFPYDGNDGIRLRIRQTRQDDSFDLIDVVISRKKLIAEFRQLGRSFADHPALVAQWYGPLQEDDMAWAEQCRSTLAALDTRFLEESHQVRIERIRAATLHARMLEVAAAGVADEDASDRQGMMYEMAIR